VPWWLLETPEKHFAFLDLYKDINFISDSVSDFVSKKKLIYEYIFVNAQRTEKTVIKELQLSQEKLGKGGLLVVENISLPCPSLLPMFNLRRYEEKLISKEKRVLIKDNLLVIKP
jgi:hypothetical protein